MNNSEILLFQNQEDNIN